MRLATAANVHSAISRSLASEKMEDQGGCAPLQAGVGAVALRMSHTMRTSSWSRSSPFHPDELSRLLAEVSPEGAGTTVEQIYDRTFPPRVVLVGFQAAEALNSNHSFGVPHCSEHLANAPAMTVVKIGPQGILGADNRSFRWLPVGRRRDLGKMARPIGLSSNLLWREYHARSRPLPYGRRHRLGTRQYGERQDTHDCPRPHSLCCPTPLLSCGARAQPINPPRASRAPTASAGC